MSYITREDGEHFVVPSYRDVLSAKKPSLLKKEVLLLSSNYGEYISLQRKNIDQYEIAFSPDPGYLLGETVWNHFKRPVDLIYCEAIPNTTEAILVVVKSGSVYLDGSFPIDSIAEELVVFKTQQNYFDVYIYGQVPISKKPEFDHFSLDESSVKSFTVLSSSAFAALQPSKSFKLGLVDGVLKEQGIGVFPVKKILILLIAMGLGWMSITYFSLHKEELPTAFVNVVNPYQSYVQLLSSPDPVRQLNIVASQIALLYTIPGWYPTIVVYSNNKTQAQVKSSGLKTKVLFEWAMQNNATVDVLPSGFYVTLLSSSVNRFAPTTISPLNQVLAEFIDRLSVVLQGNNVKLGNIEDKGKFKETQITLDINGLATPTFNLVIDQMKGLPFVLSKVDLTVTNGILTGSILLRALGS